MGSLKRPGYARRLHLHPQPPSQLTFEAGTLQEVQWVPEQGPVAHREQRLRDAGGQVRHTGTASRRHHHGLELHAAGGPQGQGLTQPRQNRAGPGRDRPSRAKSGSVQPRPTSAARASQRRASASRLPSRPVRRRRASPASPLPPLRQPPAPSASLTAQQWRRRRALRTRAEN